MWRVVQNLFGRGLVRRELITWSVVLGVILAGFGATVLVLNSTLYSPTGFVRTYLDALARHDLAGAMELSGTTSVTGDASEALLDRDAMGELTDIRVVSDDEEDATGLHYITVEYVAGGMPGTTEFSVRRDGTLFGIFNDWAFAQSPLATVQISVKHEREFTANGIDLIGQQDVAEPYLVLTPTAIELSHDSEFYHADPTEVLVDRPGGTVEAAVNIQATEAFVEAVQQQVDDALVACTTQRVLLPAGCPFGETIINRIVTEPVWTMTTNPVVTLAPDGQVATWRVPPTAATAHLVVDVQSLFDGSISTFDHDVPFTVQYQVIVQQNGKPLITPVQ
jgi:hypothetical protein